MKIKQFSFETLHVYQNARKLVVDVYYLTQYLPSEEKFGLTSQIKRAISSVTANLAEGSGRNFLKEKIHFIEIAYGSLMETFCHLTTASDLGYLEISQVESLREDFYHISRQLIALKQHFVRLLEQDQKN